jgi:nitronate monooxygenase
MTKAKEDSPAPEYSSPACLMHEAEDNYRDYVQPDELLVFLNELLEAERAGARVTLDSAHATTSEATREVLRAIHRDEGRWCSMLARHIAALDGTPSVKIGEFYAKAMAIEPMDERLVFLNRGQAWVVRKLRQMLPRVQNQRLHADFSEMLQSHEANLALVERQLT